MPSAVSVKSEPSAELAALAKCIACGHRLATDLTCASCAREYAIADGVLHAIAPLSGTNAIAAAFYDGPSWARFRPWERLFLWFQGIGEAAARRKVLRYLPSLKHARVLEIGIGDGENVPLLPADWDVMGVDIARSQLTACRSRFPKLSGRLAWAEAEALPFQDESFDVVFTIGGINYFSEPAQALREMRRVARPGATLLAADEIPDLYRFAPGHALGFEAIDTLGLRLMGLDPQFVRMVFETPARVEASARIVWPGHRRIPIWNRLGYCLVDLVEK
jgi:SAM-dependent methyltransferase